MDDLEFRLLGPVGIWQGGRLLGPATAQQRCVLAMLLLAVGQVVPVDKIETALWREDPPGSARNAVQGYVARLRRLLAGSSGAELATSGRGYCLVADRQRVDLYRFRSLVDRARAADTTGAGELLRAALQLWRGPALADVAGEWLPIVVGAGLEDERLVAVEDCIAHDLRSGEHHDALVKLSSLVAQHPFRERLAYLLMTVLHRLGRRADALKAFRDARLRLVEELGIEPGEQLQELHRQILENPSGSTQPALPIADLSALRQLPDAASILARARQPSHLDGTVEPLTAPRPTTPPRQLPMLSGRFVGRRAELDVLDAVGEGPDRLVLVVGTAGVGKTALVTQWAHAAAARFPDGQFYLDMRGFDRSARITASEAMPQLLHALGVAAEQIPIGLDAQIGMYRTAMACRRTLLVLDNVAESDQVRPLLPGDPASLVLITSRDRLSGLVAIEGARRLTLNVLPLDEAVDMVAQIVGADLVGSDPQAAAELAGLCGRLPLALRIAAGRLADRPHLTLRRQADELARHGVMAHLRLHGDERATVKGAIDLSYQALPAPASRMFRLLGLIPLPGGLSIHAGAALAAVSVADAEHLLDTLARLHLIQITESGRYTYHDLLREYAAEYVDDDPAAERDAAIRRLLDFYLHTTDNAAALTIPPIWLLPRDAPAPGVTPITFTHVDEAQDWAAAEWDNVVAGLRFAAAVGPRPLAWHLVDALRSHIYLAVSRPEWLAIAEVGLAAASQEHDQLGEAAMRFCLGFLHYRMADFQASIRENKLGATLFRQQGWKSGESTTLRLMGVSLASLGQIPQALEQFNQALAIDQQIGNQHGRAANLNNIACAYEEMGDLEKATSYLDTAIPLLRKLDRHHGVASALINVGVIRRHQGRLDDALTALEESMAICRDYGLRHEQAKALTSMGEVYCDAGRYDEAASVLAMAWDMTRQTANVRLEAFALNALASVEIALGNPTAAATRLDAALDIAARTGHNRARIGTLIALAETHGMQNQHQSACERATQALALAQGSGFAIDFARAHGVLAAAYLGLGDSSRSIDHARQALEIQQRAGQRLAQAHTLRILAQAHELAGHEADALTCWRQANAIVPETGPATAH
jgi:DNA-binding SARP family transcriptional activator